MSRIDGSVIDNGASKSFSEYESRENDTESKKMSIFSHNSNFPNIEEIIKQQVPSRFLKEAKKRIEIEEMPDDSVMENEVSIDFSKKDIARKGSGYSKYSKSVGKSLKDNNDSISSKMVDFKQLQRLVSNKNQEDERINDQKKGNKIGSNQNSNLLRESSVNTQDRNSANGSKVDKEALRKRFVRIIRNKILKNIRFFNIISKTYHLDGRALKQRYYYLYQDKSVDLEEIKKLIKDAKTKKDNDVNYILKKLGTSKSNANGVGFIKRFLFCSKDSALDEEEPDYNFKDQIDIPMKTDPIDWFVFNPYSPYLIIWNFVMAIELLAQLFMKVGVFHPAVHHLLQDRR